MLQSTTIKSEKGLRDLIARNLRKEIHPGTKPSIDFIHKILEDAYSSGMNYDVTDLRPRIISFANNSTNRADECLKTVVKMKWKSEPESPSVDSIPEVRGEKFSPDSAREDDIVAPFDVEVFPNLFVVCWKYRGSDQVVKMINPTPAEIEKLVELKLVGYNCRRFDNHILYARIMGYSNQQLFELAQKLINHGTGYFGEAYNLSYADVYDFSSKKQSLKKFMIELGHPHMEWDLPWDEPVPEELWDKVVQYCVNDVLGLEVTLEDREQDFIARQILAELSGLSVNDTTQRHTAAIIFGKDNKKPQRDFIYTDLSKEFPGYEFDRGVSTYRDEIVGEGGYVHAERGMYNDVALLDVASMHPTTIEVLNLFGPYTPRYSALKDARLAIKAGDYSAAREMFDGRLSPYLKDEKSASALAYALKIVINIVYGLTSAKFDNPFRDHRNIDNIVAKRGALFMIDLKHAVQEQGYTVAHIKTDSIKIPDATQEIIDFVINFGDKYGYEFEREATYDKFCLVNEAVYIAHKAESDVWVAVGAQFQHPYVYKKLFTGEEIEFDDLCETKQVMQGTMYLDLTKLRGPGAPPTEEMQFLGRIGRFVPVTENSGGGNLWRVKDDKAYAVTGTKGYLWLEVEMAKALGDKVEVDMSYFDKLVEDARNAIDYYGSFADFVQSRWEH